MSEILPRAQPFIQLEEAMETSSSHSEKPDDRRGKSKSPFEASIHAQDWNL